VLGVRRIAAGHQTQLIAIGVGRALVSDRIAPNPHATGSS
jgi:hypothetical protein